MKAIKVLNFLMALLAIVLLSLFGLIESGVGRWLAALGCLIVGFYWDMDKWTR